MTDVCHVFFGIIWLDYNTHKNVYNGGQKW